MKTQYYQRGFFGFFFVGFFAISRPSNGFESGTRSIIVGGGIESQELSQWQIGFLGVAQPSNTNANKTTNAKCNIAKDNVTLRKLKRHLSRNNQ